MYLCTRVDGGGVQLRGKSVDKILYSELSTRARSKVLRNGTFTGTKKLPLASKMLPRFGKVSWKKAVLIRSLNVTCFKSESARVYTDNFLLLIISYKPVQVLYHVITIVY